MRNTASGLMARRCSISIQPPADRYASLPCRATRARKPGSCPESTYDWSAGAIRSSAAAERPTPSGPGRSRACAKRDSVRRQHDTSAKRKAVTVGCVVIGLTREWGLAPVDSNHHSQIQSLVSCRWTRGQRDGKNLHGDPVRRRGAACCAPTRFLGSGGLTEPELPNADVAGAPQLHGPSRNCTVGPNTTRGGGAVSQHNGHKRSEALARLGE